LVCHPGKETTVRIERQFPEDIKIYRLKRSYLPVIINRTETNIFPQDLVSRYARYSRNVLNGSVINYHIGADTTTSWLILDHYNMMQYIAGDDYSAILKENSSRTFDGEFTAPESGEYNIVVEGHEGIGLSLEFYVEVTFELYNVSSRASDPSCMEQSCTYSDVASDEYFILSSIGGVNDVKIFYADGIDTTAVCVLVIIAIVILGVDLLYVYFYFHEEYGKKETYEDKLRKEGVFTDKGKWVRLIKLHNEGHGIPLE